jgi:electron transport complex protein RnfG
MSETESVAAQTRPAPDTPGAAMLRTLGLVAALSGFLVVFSYEITKPMIAENQRLAIERALFSVVPGASARRDFVIKGQALLPAGEAGADGIPVYAGYDAQGNLMGVALEAAAQGYQDVIRILYGYDPDCQCIRGIQVLKMAETPGIGDKIAKDAKFLKNFEALDVALNTAGDALANAIVSVKAGTKSQPWQIDAISGATISSKAVAKMLDQSARAVLPVLQANLGVLKQAPAAGPDTGDDGSTNP